MKKNKGWFSRLLVGDHKAAADVPRSVAPADKNPGAFEKANGTGPGATTILPNEVTQLAEAASGQSNYGLATSSNNPSDAETGVPLEWAVGDVILDLYEVTDRFESGAMGLVYRVRHNGWGIDLAVKAPRQAIFSNDGGQAAFEREAETWVKLGSHPNVVTCYHVRSLGGVPRVFAEFVAGGSLKEWITGGAQGRNLYEGGQGQVLARMLDIAIQFAWGLAFAHEQGLVHRDVKPANVMLTPYGVAKVCDFGLAKAQEASSGTSVWQQGSDPLKTVGGLTPAYASSEQLAGKAPHASTDVWSWAVSVLEMFVGEVFWLSGSAAAHALEAYLENGSVNSSIPPMPSEMAKVLQLCFAPEPNDRPTCLEVANELAKIYEKQTGAAYPREVPNVADAVSDNLNNQALSMMDLGRVEEAENTWRQALKTDPQHLEAVYNSGVVRWRQGAITDDVLVRQLEAICNVKGESWEAKYLLARVHLERDDIDAALPLLVEAAKITADSSVRNILNQVQSNKKNTGRCQNIINVGQPIISTDSSPECDFALSGTYSFNPQFWDMRTGELLRSLEGHTAKINSVSLSADRRFALTGSSDKTLRLWEAETGNCLRTFEGHTESVEHVILSADGRVALSAGLAYDNAVRLWDASTGNCLRTFEPTDKSFVQGICVNIDCSLVLVASIGWLQCWDTQTGRCLYTRKLPLIGSICLSADGRYALSAGSDEKLRLWEVKTGNCLRTIQQPSEPLSICLNSNGTLASTGSKDNFVRLWDVQKGRCLRTFTGHTEEVKSVNISKNQRFILSGSSDSTLRLWAMPARSPLTCELRLAKPQSNAEVEAANRAVSADIDMIGQAIEHSDYPRALEVLNSIGSDTGLGAAKPILEAKAELSLFCQKTGLRSAWSRGPFEDSVGPVESICLSPDGHFALGGSWAGAVLLWEVATGRIVRLFEAHGGMVKSVCFSADGKFALSGSTDNILVLWDVSSGRCMRKFTGHTDGVGSVCLSADARFALSGSWDRTMRLWEVSTARCLRSFEGHHSPVASVLFSNDSRLALSASWPPLRVWDAATGDCLRTCSGRHKGGHGQQVEAASMGANSRYLISASMDSTLCLWDVSTGSPLRKFVGHTGIVWSVCLSLDGRFALSGASDKTVRVWDVNTGECLRVLEGHTDIVLSVCLSADGRFALSAGNDKTVRLWELDWELEARAADDWDEGAHPILEEFLTRQIPYANELQIEREPSDQEIVQALTRSGKPSWTEKEFQGLVQDLRYAGFGWLRPEGVRRQLESMAVNWRAPSEG